MQTRIELGVGPDGLELHRADRVRVRGGLDIHGATDPRYHAGPFVGLAVTRPDDVEGLLEALPVLRPAFDDLNAIEVSGGRILDRPDNERRRLGLDWWQVAAHRHALRVAGLDPRRVVQHGRGVLPPAEEAHLDVRPADREGLLALHALEQRGAGVLFSPHARQSARAN